MVKKPIKMMMVTGRRESEMDRESYDPMRHYPINPEGKFRDRRGRWHYDNGRYAPKSWYDELPDYSDLPDHGMASYYEGEKPMGRYDETPMRRERRRTDPVKSWYEEPYYPDGYPIRSRYPDTNGVPGPIDMPDESDEDEEIISSRTRRIRSHYGDEQRRESPERRIGFVSGGKSSDDTGHFNKEMAMRWAQELENDDGTRGPHWDMEKAKQIMAQYGINVKPYIGYIVLNMIYSDYSNVFKKRGVNDVETYACMAKAFIEDEDAKPIEERLYNYYKYIFDGK